MPNGMGEGLKQWGLQGSQVACSSWLQENKKLKLLRSSYMISLTRFNVFRCSHSIILIYILLSHTGIHTPL